MLCLVCHAPYEASVYFFRSSVFYRDVLQIDIGTGKLLNQTKFPEGLKPRANHTATLVGSHIWFIGGGDGSQVFEDVFALDTVKGTWRVVSVT